MPAPGVRRLRGSPRDAGYREPFLLSLHELEQWGQAFGAEHPGHFESEMAKGTADEIVIICYTFGHDGCPQGHPPVAPQPDRHRDECSARGGAPERRRDPVLPARGLVGDHISSYAQSIIVGFTANCPESAATVLADLKEIGPTYFFAPPRIWENILTGVMIRIEDAAWPKRAMARFFLDLAQDLERRSRVSTWGAWRAVPMPPFASGASAPSLARRRTTLLGGLMRRVFEVDVLVCPRCGGRRRLVAGYSGGHRLLEPWTGSASARLRASRPPRGSLLSTRPPD